MKAKYEEKFIVINRKHLEKLLNKKSENRSDYKVLYPIKIIEMLRYLLDELNPFLPDNKYYVCNQDEPYAQKVIDIILEGEALKEQDTTSAK